jgi:hypothetical protein
MDGNFPERMKTVGRLLTGRGLSGKAMFGAKEGGQRYPGFGVETCGRGMAMFVDSGGMGDQTDPAA